MSRIPSPLIVIALIYALGAVVTLVATDDTPARRVGLALLWPLGPLAFGVTVVLLLVTALVAFPVVAASLIAAAAAAGWWALR